jgi:hypothetical protein
MNRMDADGEDEGELDDEFENSLDQEDVAATEEGGFRLNRRGRLEKRIGEVA